MKYLLIYNDGEMQIEVYEDSYEAAQQFYLIAAVAQDAAVFEVCYSDGSVDFRRMRPEELRYPRGEDGMGLL